MHRPHSVVLSWGDTGESNCHFLLYDFDLLLPLGFVIRLVASSVIGCRNSARRLFCFLSAHNTVHQPCSWLREGLSVWFVHVLFHLWGQFWIVTVESRAFPSFMTAFFRFLEETNALVLENPYWITWSCHFENVSNFLSSHCLWKFCDSPLLENWGKCICTQDQSNLWDCHHLPPSAFDPFWQIVWYHHSFRCPCAFNTY